MCYSDSPVSQRLSQDRSARAKSLAREMEHYAYVLRQEAYQRLQTVRNLEYEENETALISREHIRSLRAEASQCLAEAEEIRRAAQRVRARAGEPSGA